MIEIRPLTHFNADDLKRIAIGYTSNARYNVLRIETEQRIAISLELQALDQPYVKVWDHNPGLMGYYRQVVKEGLSLAAYDGDKMIGLAIATGQAWNALLTVWELHIAESKQRQGVGRQLVERLIEQGKEAGLRAVQVETHNTNVGAIRFYQRMGFELEGIDLSFYTNHDVEKGEIALFMRRRLD